MEEKPVFSVAKQGAAPIKSEQLQLACGPEIKDKAFNSKFASISKNESSSWQNPTSTRSRKFSYSTTDTFQDNFSRDRRPSSYRSYSSHYYDQIQNDYSYLPKNRPYISTYDTYISNNYSHTPNYHSRSKYSSSDRLSSASSSSDYRQSSDTIVNFYPVVQKGPNYLKYCTGWLSEYEKPLNTHKCVLKYTSGSHWYCSEINFALASDSSNLLKYGSYIKELKYCIGMSSNYVGTVYRGLFFIVTHNIAKKNIRVSFFFFDYFRCRFIILRSCSL